MTLIIKGMLLFLLILMAYPAYSMENGVAGRWHFDESKGGIVHDGSGNNNHGTVKGASKIL